MIEINWKMSKVSKFFSNVTDSINLHRLSVNGNFDDSVSFIFDAKVLSMLRSDCNILRPIHLKLFLLSPKLYENPKSHEKGWNGDKRFAGGGSKIEIPFS